jgi:hypothetical protein
MEAKKKPCDGNLCQGALQYIWKNAGGKKFCIRCWSAQSKSNTKPTVVRKKIAARSSKKIKQDALYSPLRRKFLEENPTCQARIQGKCTRIATQVHHKAGRIGSLYLDVSKWLAICHECHTWITEFSKEAIEMGLSESRNT